MRRHLIVTAVGLIIIAAALVILAIWLVRGHAPLFDAPPPSAEMRQIRATVLAYDRAERSWLALPAGLIDHVRRQWQEYSQAELRRIARKVNAGHPPNRLPVTLPAGLKRQMYEQRMVTVRRTCTGKWLTTCLRSPWDPGRELELSLNSTLGVVPLSRRVTLVWFRFRGHREGGDVAVRGLFWQGTRAQEGSTVTRSQFWFETDFLLHKTGGVWRIADDRYMADYLPPSGRAWVFSSFGPNSPRGPRTAADGRPEEL